MMFTSTQPKFSADNLPSMRHQLSRRTFTGWKILAVLHHEVLIHHLTGGLAARLVGMSERIETAGSL